MKSGFVEVREKGVPIPWWWATRPARAGRVTIVTTRTYTTKWATTTATATSWVKRAARSHSRPPNWPQISNHPLLVCALPHILLPDMKILVFKTKTSKKSEYTKGGQGSGNTHGSSKDSNQANAAQGGQSGGQANAKKTSSSNKGFVVSIIN